MQHFRGVMKIGGPITSTVIESSATGYTINRPQRGVICMSERK